MKIKNFVAKMGDDFIELIFNLKNGGSFIIVFCFLRRWFIC